MNGGSALGSARVDDGHAPFLATPPLDLAGSTLTTDEEPEAYRPPEPLRLLLPALALLLAAVWVGAACWLGRDAVVRMPWPALIEFAAAVASVPVLIGVVWLLTQRTSRAEARRFAHTAAGMRVEAAALERTVASLAAALNRNREHLAEQARGFEELGIQASDKLARVGSDWAAEMAQAEQHSAALAAAARDAQASLGVLIASLPRARAETVEAAELLDQAGASASQAAIALDAQVAALTDRAREADALAGAAAARLATHVAEVEHKSNVTGARLEAVTGEMASAVDALLDRTTRALDEARHGIAAQNEAMLATVSAHRATLDHVARESADALASRIELVELAIDRIAARLDAQRVAGDSLFKGLDDGIIRVGTQLDVLHTQGVERTQLLAASISALGGSADAMTEALRTGDATAREVIGTAESLLIALDASAREIDETLPDALARLDARIVQSRQVVGSAKPELLALVTAAESTHDAIEAIAQVIAGQRTALDQLSGALLDTLATGRGKADALGTIVDETVARAHRFADEAAPRLLEALLRVRDTANAAADKARETLAGVIPEAANKLEAASGAALARAAGASVDRQVAAIANAADAAVRAATRASDRLGDRLRELSDTTALVDTRLTDARAERQEADRDSFAQRVSALIEQLNSASIDITKGFAPDVTDSAWAAYLKGDRGVFTRRAVRLLDSGQAREVARLYDEDVRFREQVNRYIHDFEAMLRAVLAQPDGSPLGVTLLSSDMGKLYVALAQGVERLR